MWMALIPFAAFAAAFLLGAVGLWFLVKTTKISQTYTSAGKVLHMESPLGTLDERHEAKVDPRLAQIPVYPGALAQNPAAPEAVSELRFAGAIFQDISVTYWTPDDLTKVWNFYRQRLPDFQVNLDAAQSKELIQRGQDYVRLVRVYGQAGRTVIETCIKPPDYPNGFGSGS